MIEWLAALKGLISAKINNAIHISANPNTVITKGTKKTTQSVVYNNNGSGNVNVFQIQLPESGEVSPEVLEQIKKVIIPEFEKGDVMLLQQDSQKLLRDFNDFKSNPDTNEILDFFKGKISELDYRLLETGLYEAFLLENNDIEKARQVKDDIVKRYGTRAKNIVNLASGGYFKTHIRPLYEALSTQEHFDTRDFEHEYERIVEELPFAIFVHSGLNDDEIILQLEEKSAKNIKYGVSEETIILNGFGNNADLIEKLIPALKKRYRRIAPSTQYLGSLKTVQVAVYYREVVEDFEVE